MQQILRLGQLPVKATEKNIKLILDTMEAFDKKADKAHQLNNFQKAMEYSEFVRQLDELIANYNGELPEGSDYLWI